MTNQPRFANRGVSRQAEIQNQLFPNGNANDDKAKWNANDWNDANDNYGVVALMR
jgi:hypothetical protein